jgi:hypothetical protein
MKKTLLTSIAALFLATGTAHARGVTTTCEGKIDWYPLSAYTAITKNSGTSEVKDECIFVTSAQSGSSIGVGARRHAALVGEMDWTCWCK